MRYHRAHTGCEDNIPLRGTFSLATRGELACVYLHSFYFISLDVKQIHLKLDLQQPALHRSLSIFTRAQVLPVSTKEMRLCAFFGTSRSAHAQVPAHSPFSFRACSFIVSNILELLLSASFGSFVQVLAAGEDVSTATVHSH